MDINQAVGGAKDFLSGWMNRLTTPAQPTPKLPRSQQELADYRKFKAGQTQAQVNADAKAGGDAMRNYGKGKPSVAKPSVAKGAAGAGKAGGLVKGAGRILTGAATNPVAGPIIAVTGGLLGGLAVDSQRTGRERGFTSGRGEGRRGATETGGSGHIPVTTYAMGGRVPSAVPMDIRGTSGNNYKRDELELAEKARQSRVPSTYTPPVGDAEPPLTPDESTRTGGGVTQTGRQLGGMISLEDATKLSGGYLADLSDYLPRAELTTGELAESQDSWTKSNPNESAGNVMSDANDQARTVAMPGAPTNWMQQQPGSLRRNAAMAFLDAPDGSPMAQIRARNAQYGIVEAEGGRKFAQINGQMVELDPKGTQYSAIVGGDREAISELVAANPRSQPLAVTVLQRM